MQLSFFDPLTYSYEIGAVIATDTSPSTSIVDAVLKNETIDVSRGEILEIPYSSKEILIVLVKEIQKSNTYFSNAGVLKDRESYSRINQELFPTDEWATTFLLLKPLGVYSEKGIKRVKIPINPGSKIFKARSQLMTEFFGFSRDGNGLNLGYLTAVDTPVNLEFSKLLRKHLAILAISGAGKSYSTSVLLEELINRPKESGRLPVLILDPHGEYTYFANKNQVTNKSTSLVTVYPGNYFSISTQSLSAWKIREYSQDISAVQVRELDRIIIQLKKNNSLNSFMDIILEIENNSVLNSRTRESLLGWLDGLLRLEIFGSVDFPIIKDLLIPGQISVIDLSKIQSIKKKQIICAHIARTAFSLRRKGNVSPFLLIIEEAHQFCPEQERSISKNIIETIAREGRKFFASLCLISQRPIKLSSTALSQCNTHLIMKIKNPYDLDYIGRLSEGIDRDTQKMLPDLEVGEAFLVGEAVKYPILFKIREKSDLGNEYDKTQMEKEILRFDN
ncbi:MAG: ATP-binding protein [Candidatus Hodarchaeales archaeon]|jgi:DNA helicase HerA-like ATPase